MSSPNKPHNNGQWTDARKKSFIVSLLRGGFQRWGPKQLCIKNARVRRGWYLCEECREEVPATLPPKPGNKKRIKNIVADHIDPIVDPATGFEGFETWIDRAFVELDGFQALCHACHEKKTAAERGVAKERRANDRSE